MRNAAAGEMIFLETEVDLKIRGKAALVCGEAGPGPGLRRSLAREGCASPWFAASAGAGKNRG